MIQMTDLQKEYAMHADALSQAFAKSMKKGWYIMGKNLEKFEEEFAAYNGAKYCIGVGNGLEAIQIALMALGIGKGDEVITPANSFVATALAIANTGAKAVLVDIDAYYHIDPEELERKITRKTKAILPVHLYGQIVNMQAIRAIAKKHNLSIVEDACQAHGATLNGKKAGTLGDLGCFSFYPTKNLGAYGDGGAIVTNSKKLYEKCKMLRNYGQSKKYHHKYIGLNSRLDELQAAFLSIKLKQLDASVAKRNVIAQTYFEQLADVPEIELPLVRDNTVHAYHLFVIKAQYRDKLQKYLKTHRIETMVHYPVPIHKQPCFSAYNTLLFTHTEKDARTILSLPMHPFLEKQDVVNVCTTIKKFYREIAARRGISEYYESISARRSRVYRVSTL